MPNGHIEYTTKHFGVIEGELGGMYQKKEYKYCFYVLLKS
jgi:hypothetical protein